MDRKCQKYDSVLVTLETTPWTGPYCYDTLKLRIDKNTSAL